MSKESFSLDKKTEPIKSREKTKRLDRSLNLEKRLKILVSDLNSENASPVIYFERKLRNVGDLMPGERNASDNYFIEGQGEEYRIKQKLEEENVVNDKILAEIYVNPDGGYKGRIYPVNIEDLKEVDSFLRFFGENGITIRKYSED